MPKDGNEAMFAAFQAFGNSMRRVQMGNAIQEAQKKVDEIKNNQEMNEFEQIKAQQSIAQMTAASIAAAGGDASMIQQARLALAPEIPDAAMRSMEATGKGTLAEAQQHLLDEAETKAEEKEGRAHSRAKELLDIKIKAEKLEAERKANGKAPQQLPNPIFNKLSELKDSLSQLKGLKEGFEKNKGAIGPYDQFKTDKFAGLPGAGIAFGTLNSDEAVYRKDVKDFFNQYRKVITGAAASMPELKDLLAAVPNAGDDQTVFIKGIDKHIGKVESALTRRVKLLKAKGMDTSDLEEGLDLIGDMKDSAPPPPGGGKEPASTAPAPSGSATPSWLKRRPKE